jgi:site-specific DNA-methyltransferase (adenine-specific)
MNQLINKDCIEALKQVPDKSVNLIVIDPPYNINKAAWDRIANYNEWMLSVFLELQRVLADNGSFYFFHNDFLRIVELQALLSTRTRFIFKQFMVWNKRFDGYHNQLNALVHSDDLRNYSKQCEYFLYYTFQDETGLTTVMLDTNNFSTLRRYFKELQEYIGVSKKEILSKIGQCADHCFRWKSTQWDIPTPETYQKCIDTYNINWWPGFRAYESLRQEYESLRQEYESLRQEYESLRYTFNNQKTHHSVWNYEVADKRIGHITPKPLELIKNIIKHSSNEGDTVLDCFMGSGTTCLAAQQLGRQYIGIELNEKYFQIATKRLQENP